MINIRTLPNGLRIVLEEIPYVRSISFGLWVKNGSRNEPKKLNGISHFIEHMLFKGTENRSGKDIAEDMDSVGGQINAYTTKEYTCYHTRTLDKHFETALDIISDMFLNSKFDNEEIKKECNVIIEEINMYQDTPDDLVHENLQESVWQDCSLGMPILGKIDTISSFDSETIKDYFYKNYQIENTIISVAGSFKEDEVFELMNKYFGNFKNKYKKDSFYSKTNYTPTFISEKKEIEQVHLCLALPGIERGNKDRYAYSVFNTIFGGGMSSRLFQKIREENGLTYSIYSYMPSYIDNGLFAIYAGMSPNQSEKTINLIFDEITKLKDAKISEGLINKTKEQIISSFIISNESTINRMTSSGGSVLLKDRVQTQEEIIEEVEGINYDDIQRIIDDTFNMSNLSLSVVGKTDAIDFEKILDEGRQIVL